LKRIYLALGSNLGDREAHLRRAIDLLRAPALKITAVSPVYETAPQGKLDQGWFLNLVLQAETSLFPMQLLGHCARIELVLKRRRSVSNGPRTIDIDVLFYGRSIIHCERLTAPHPRYRERRFVLQPLADLDPDLRDPATRESITAMLARVNDQEIRRTAIVIAAEPLS
jgi:2-amino-4-hydroxy-6-hydroxymethyldihydropteridine diphosphokinase